MPLQSDILDAPVILKQFHFGEYDFESPKINRNKSINANEILQQQLEFTEINQELTIKYSREDMRTRMKLAGVLKQNS